MATAARLNKLKEKYHEYPDDIFQHTRMSMGDHIEELRYRLIAGLKWLLFFMLIGFVLAAIGPATERPTLGVGKPMLKVITEPVESQTRDFYYRRAQKIHQEKI